MANKTSTGGKKAAVSKKTTPKTTATKAAARVKATKAAAPAKKVPAKAPAGKKIDKGDSLVCETCGLTVLVDECGDVLAAQEIICCGKAMKKKASRSKAAKK